MLYKELQYKYCNCCISLYPAYIAKLCLLLCWCINTSVDVYTYLLMCVHINWCVHTSAFSVSSMSVVEVSEVFCWFWLDVQASVHQWSWPICIVPCGYIIDCTHARTICTVNNSSQSLVHAFAYCIHIHVPLWATLQESWSHFLCPCFATKYAYLQFKILWAWDRHIFWDRITLLKRNPHETIPD